MFVLVIARKLKTLKYIALSIIDRLLILVPVSGRELLIRYPTIDAVLEGRPIVGYGKRIERSSKRFLQGASKLLKA